PHPLLTCGHAVRQALSALPVDETDVYRQPLPAELAVTLSCPEEVARTIQSWWAPVGGRRPTRDLGWRQASGRNDVTGELGPTPRSWGYQLVPLVRPTRR